MAPASTCGLDDPRGAWRTINDFVARDRGTRSARWGQALSFHALRRLGLAEAVRDRVVQRRPSPAADALLCTSLALMASDGGTLYPAFTLVDQTVEAAKRHASLRSSAAFLNACLRRFLREREELLGPLLSNTVARWNHPNWWVERLQRDHPAHWRSILGIAQSPAPMVLRVNTRRISVQAFCDRLASAGIPARVIDGAAVNSIGHDRCATSLATPQDGFRCNRLRPSAPRRCCSLEWM